jgi:AraC-like DNA-binding protein
MLLYLSILGLLLSTILFFFNAKTYRSSVYLSGFFFLVSFYSLTVYILFYSKSVFLVSIFYINTTFTGYLIGPMLYWYIRSIITDDARLRRKDSLHLLPSIIFLLTALPYTFGPYTEKVRIASEIVKNINFMGTYKPTILYSFVPTQLIFLSRALLVLIYVVVSSWMLARYLKPGKITNILFNQRFMVNWLIVLLSFLILLVISHILMLIEVISIRDSIFFYSLNVLQVISVIGLIGLLISPLFFPSILYGMPAIPHSTAERIEAAVAGIENALGDQKIKGVAFEIDYLQEMEQIIESSMRELKPYLQKDFNLPQLSVMANIPVHHLAYFFRENKNQTFHDYRNKWRVEHSKKLIEEGKTKTMTLEAIGFLSGFSSRNTYFIAFKRIEGISPREFVRRFKSL